MKMIRSTTITGVPGFDKIEVRPDATGEPASVIVLAPNSEFAFDTHACRVFPQSFSLDAARELRDALSAAIEEAEALTIVLDAGRAAAPKPVELFVVGQELNGAEDLPVGTVIKDCDGTPWTRHRQGWTWAGNRPFGRSLSFVVERYGPVRIMSLPGGES